MRGNMSVNKFANVSEFGALVESRDDYRLLPVYAEYAGHTVSSERVYGMTNITRNRITMACGPKYPVFGHREALGYVLKELESRKMKVHGSISQAGDTTWTKVLFDGIELKDNTDSRVELGVEFVNPMDKKTKFRGYGYTFRQTCSNGAGIKTLLPNVEINESHTEQMLAVVPPMIHDFIGRSLANTNFMQQVITNAMATKVVFESKEQLKATLGGLFFSIAERHVNHIIERVEGLEPTRWDLFNASNFYTSHSAISPTIREQIDVVAESFLAVNRPINPVNIRKVAPLVQAQ